jgi:hypothetical protein
MFRSHDHLKAGLQTAHNLTKSHYANVQDKNRFITLKSSKLIRQQRKG